MSPLRAEEEWVRLVVARALGAAVCQHDDQSRDGMYDLRIEYSCGDFGAMEVTAAADGESIALWKLLNGSEGRWIESAIEGGWMVSLDPRSRAKVLRERLPGLLHDMERLGQREPRTQRRRPDALSREAAELGVVTAYQSGTAFPGSIYTPIELPSERSGGFVADTGNALAAWVGEFLRDEGRSDVRAKLHESALAERHAFVILPGFATADFSVTDLLMRDEAPLPSLPPQLPAEVTHVWVASTWSTGGGMRWAADAGWSRFDKSMDAAA